MYMVFQLNSWSLNWSDVNAVLKYKLCAVTLKGHFEGPKGQILTFVIYLH